MLSELLFDLISLESPHLEWPFTIPAIHHIVEHPLHLDNQLTIIVGDNGSGKSTFMEALAEKISLRSSGGPRFRTKTEITTVLAKHLKIHYTMAGLAAVKRSKPRLPGFFLRSETGLAMMEALETLKLGGYQTPWNHVDPTCLSHGEGFLEVLAAVLAKPGIFLLDEPESGLTFTRQLQLVALLHQTANHSSITQIICATHSPVLAATPGAKILEFTSAGITESSWQDLELVHTMKRFLNNPQQYLDYLW